jgi:rubrerythrin
VLDDPKEDSMKREQLEELLYQALETELGGEQVYIKAIECAQNEDLHKEWEKYLAETRTHQEILGRIFTAASLDHGVETPGRKVVRHKAEALIAAMDMALEEAGPEAAELVAAESVVEAETKDHQNWELLARVAGEVDGDLAEALNEAYDEVGEQEAEHLFHTQGWARELWLQSLGMAAALPPPEEEKSVKTQIGAARAEQQRDEYTN